MKLDVVYCHQCCCNHPPGQHNQRRLNATMAGKPPPPGSWEGEPPAEGSKRKITPPDAPQSEKTIKARERRAKKIKENPSLAPKRNPKGAGRKRPEGYQRDLMRIRRDAAKQGLTLKAYRRKYKITGAQLPKHLKDDGK